MKGEDVFWGAGAPAALGIADADGFGPEIPNTAEMMDPARQIASGLLFVPGPDQCLAMIAYPAVQDELLIPETEQLQMRAMFFNHQGVGNA